MSYEPGGMPPPERETAMDPEVRQRAREAVRRRKQRAAALKWTVGGSTVAILVALLWFMVLPMMATRALSSAMKAATNATSLLVKARMSVDVGMSGMNQSMEIPFEVDYQHPNSIKATVGKEGAFIKVYSDGKSMQFALPVAHTVIKMPAPPDLAGLKKDAGAAKAVPAPDLDGLKIRPGIHSKSDWIKTRVAPAGSQPFTVSSKDGGLGIVWVDLRSQMPKMIAFDMKDNEAALKSAQGAAGAKGAMPNPMAGMDMRMQVTFDELKINPTLPASTFDYKPAATTKVMEASTPEQAMQMLTGALLSNPAAMQELEKSLK